MKIAFEEDSDSELDHMMKSTTTQEVSSTVEKQGEQEKRTQDLSRALFGLPSLEFCRN